MWRFRWEHPRFKGKTLPDVQAATLDLTHGRGAPVENLPTAAGLGRVDDAARLIPSSDVPSRHVALAVAAQLGQTEILRRLLDAGEDPNRYSPDGFHFYATPLHQAVWNGHIDVVLVLVELGARVDIRDTIYLGTLLNWAVYGGNTRLRITCEALARPVTLNQIEERSSSRRPTR